MSTSNTGTTSTTQKEVSTNAVLEMLHSGKTRKEINTELGLSFAEARYLWNTPSLKGKKTTPKVNLTVVDDIPAKAPATPTATSVDNGANVAPASAPTAVAETTQAEDIEPKDEESLWDRK